MEFNTRGLLFTFKTRFIFLVFHQNIGLKTSTYEFTDRIHQISKALKAKS